MTGRFQRTWIAVAVLATCVPCIRSIPGQRGRHADGGEARVAVSHDGGSQWLDDDSLPGPVGVLCFLRHGQATHNLLKLQVRLPCNHHTHGAVILWW